MFDPQPKGTSKSKNNSLERHGNHWTLEMIQKLTVGVTLLVAAGTLAFSTLCPCGPTPGAYLFGAEAQTPIDDWSFVNQVPLCQLEVTTWRPHSVNLNCMSSQGQLYISCSNCAAKSWSRTAETKGIARIRAGEMVYPVTLNRVIDAAELERAWAARLKKIQQDPVQRPSHWWSFKLISR